MVKQLYIKKASGFANSLGQVAITSTGCKVSGRMVMRHDNGCGI